MKLVYLASPYSHPSALIRNQRWQAAAEAVAALMVNGRFVLSPICHSHPVALFGGVSGHYEHWRAFDELLISRCDAVWVLKLDGWQTSVGVNAEIEYARKLGKLVLYLNAETLKVENE